MKIHFFLCMCCLIFTTIGCNGKGVRYCGVNHEENKRCHYISTKNNSLLSNQVHCQSCKPIATSRGAFTFTRIIPRKEPPTALLEFKNIMNSGSNRDDIANLFYPKYRLFILDKFNIPSVFKDSKVKDLSFDSVIPYKEYGDIIAERQLKVLFNKNYTIEKWNVHYGSGTFPVFVLKNNNTSWLLP